MDVAVGDELRVGGELEARLAQHVRDTRRAMRMVDALGPVEVLRSLPISILTVFMIGWSPPNSVSISSQYLSGCCDL